MDRGTGPQAGARGSGRPAELILADTSAWIEYLRATGSPVDAEIDGRPARSVAVADPVRMELLAGPARERAAEDLRLVLAGMPSLDAGREDFESAAWIYRACRGAGHTMRSQLDCLIAAIAIRHRVPLLHSDSDFDRIAELTPLEVYEPA